MEWNRCGKLKSLYRTPYNRFLKSARLIRLNSTARIANNLKMKRIEFLFLFRIGRTKIKKIQIISYSAIINPPRLFSQRNVKLFEEKNIQCQSRATFSLLSLQVIQNPIQTEIDYYPNSRNFF